MREKDNNTAILKKGFYNHLQEYTYVQLKQYIIVQKDDKRCLLLRFFNESELKIDGIDIVLTQFDADREIIDSSVVRFSDTKVRPGETYTPDEGIVIDDRCADFTVTVKSIVSDAYVYSLVGGAFVPGYDPRMNKKVKRSGRGKISVKRKNMTSSRISAIAAALLVVGTIVLSVALSVSFHGRLSASAFSVTENV